MMVNKIVGGILLIIGTSIGGGLLALPMATAGGGFIHSLWLFLGAWLVTVFGAFFILEVNLWLPEHTNMVSMAKATLGIGGQIVTWFIYLLLLYALLSAYIAGGSDLINNLLNSWHLPTPSWVSAILFVILFGTIVHKGIRTVDRSNRILMTIKIAAYVLLILLIIPHTQYAKLQEGEMRLVAGAAMVVVTSFGYATIIPSLRTYLNSNVKALRLAIGVGSLIPLICYILWDFAVQGSVIRNGAPGLMQMANSPHAVSELTRALSEGTGNNLIPSAAHLFTAICVTTSFLGVALCLWDFLADGLHMHKQRTKRWQISSLSFLPPLLVVVFFPGIFVKALAYAGVICVILLMFLPGLMAWSGRYMKKMATGYRVWGGKWILASEIAIAFILTIVGLIEVLGS